MKGRKILLAKNIFTSFNAFIKIFSVNKGETKNMTMQVQPKMNNQTSFGMALKVDKQTLKVMKNHDLLDRFNSELPALKKASKDVNVQIYTVRHYMGADFVYEATPVNKLKMNNFLSYTYNLIKNKVGQSRCEASVQSYLIEEWPEKYSFLTKVEEAKAILNKKMSEVVKKSDPIKEAQESLKNQ